MESTTDSRRLALAFALLAAPFYLNDLANMMVRDWRVWLALDYIVVKLLPLAAIVWLVRSGRMRASDFGWTPLPLPRFLIWFLLLSLVGTALDQNGYTMASRVPGYGPLGGMPPIDSPVWNWIDLTLGLLLVALMEELVFRGLAFSVLQPHLGRVGIVAASALAFGLIHWSLGLQAVVVTGVIGAVFMAAYLRMRSVLPIIAAHFVVNFIDFAGVVPKPVFKFL